MSGCPGSCRLLSLDPRTRSAGDGPRPGTPESDGSRSASRSAIMSIVMRPVTAPVRSVTIADLDAGVEEQRQRVAGKVVRLLSKRRGRIGHRLGRGGPSSGRPFGVEPADRLPRAGPTRRRNPSGSASPRRRASAGGPIGHRRLRAGASGHRSRLRDETLETAIRADEPGDEVRGRAGEQVWPGCRTGRACRRPG